MVLENDRKRIEMIFIVFWIVKGLEYNYVIES